jgi:hypothetical protein
MSESETAKQTSLEQPPELASEDARPGISNPARTNHHPSSPSNSQASSFPLPPVLPAAIKHTEPSEPRPHTSSASSNTHRDLAQIIARAREEIRHLREELSRHEAQIARTAQERDQIQLDYAHLRDSFMEAVHMAAEEQILKTTHDLQEGRIPQLLEPLRESLTFWLAKQQAEREAVIRQKLETVERHAAIIRQELIREREALNAEREKFAQERQTFLAQMKARETWLQNRWLVKAWGTAAVMFLVLPALQVYLVTQKAGLWNIIIIPTTICLVLTALINLARSRNKPPVKS